MTIWLNTICWLFWWQIYNFLFHKKRITEWWLKDSWTGNEIKLKCACHQDIWVTERSQKVVFQSQFRKTEMWGFFLWRLIGLWLHIHDCTWTLNTKFHLLVILFYIKWNLTTDSDYQGMSVGFKEPQVTFRECQGIVRAIRGCQWVLRDVR